MTAQLHRPPVVGDTVELGHATLSVRKLNAQGGVQTVGLGLNPNTPAS
jgi:hypothetical protein